MGEDKLLTTKEATDRLGISRKTLYAMMKRGQIEPANKKAYLKKNPKLQFRESDVERLLKGEAADEDRLPIAV